MGALCHPPNQNRVRLIAQRVNTVCPFLVDQDPCRVPSILHRLDTLSIKTTSRNHWTCLLLGVHISPPQSLWREIRRALPVKLLGTLLSIPLFWKTFLWPWPFSKFLPWFFKFPKLLLWLSKTLAANFRNFAPWVSKTFAVKLKKCCWVSVAFPKCFLTVVEAGFNQIVFALVLKKVVGDVK